MSQKKLTWVLPFVMLPAAVFASPEVTFVNRYATVANKPLPAQLNPLLAIQQVDFPATVQSLGQAVTYWLRDSGYRLAPFSQQPVDLTILFEQLLPQAHRHLGPLTIQEGLTVLVGASLFTVVADPLRRAIHFHRIHRIDRKPAQQTHSTSHAINDAPIACAKKNDSSRKSP